MWLIRQCLSSTHEALSPVLSTHKQVHEFRTLGRWKQGDREQGHSQLHTETCLGDRRSYLKKEKVCILL